jgi:hypothetical protein
MLVLLRVVLMTVFVMVAVCILANAEQNQEHPSDETYRPTQNKSLREHIDPKWLVHVCHLEVRLCEEKHADHRNTTDEMADTQDETRCKSIDPFIRLVQCIGGCNRPSVAWFHSVDSSKSNCTSEKPDRVSCGHYNWSVTGDVISSCYDRFEGIVITRG